MQGKSFALCTPSSWIGGLLRQERDRTGRGKNGELEDGRKQGMGMQGE